MASALKDAPIADHDDPSLQISWPGFDHAAQDPCEDAITITATDHVVLLEGNYVLLRKEPWLKISTLADEGWFIDVDEDTAMQRLALRYVSVGIGPDMAAGRTRADKNDKINGRLIRESMMRPDAIIQN